MALIDVLLPVKNGGLFLPIALDSIRNQTFGDWRLLVLDHGSTDGSRKVAESYAARDLRIEVHSFPDANGLSGLLNKGLDLSDCRYILRHDADDIAYPDRMEHTLDAFRAQRDCVVIGGQADIIDRAGVKTGRVIRPIARRRISAGCFFWNPIIHPTVMMDFAFLNKIGARYGADFLRAVEPARSIEVPSLAEDHFLFGQLALLGKCSNMPPTVIQYRQHDRNIGVTCFREQMAVSLKISRFLMRSFCIMHGLAYVDPAPFCNHGGALFDVDGRTDFSGEFEKLVSVMRRGFGESEELEREIDYRRSISTRGNIRMLLRHGLFSLKHASEYDERNAVREWIIGKLRGRDRIRVTGEIDVSLEGLAYFGRSTSSEVSENL
jgi:glycosyltransferase involved in cell wall biosynthesis